MNPDLTGQVALVSGAGRGIGRSIAISLARAGAFVYLAARTESELQAVADEIQCAGGQASPLPLDLADESQIVGGFETIHRASKRLDILINNAGVGLFGAIRDYDTAKLDQTLSINVRSTFIACREALKWMSLNKSGYIINIGSVVSFRGYPNQGAYAASKHAMLGLTKSLSIEAQPMGIRVSAILPGGVDTEMSANSRPDLARDQLISTEDIANSVLYLLSLSKTNAAVDQIYIRRKTSQPF